MDDFAPIVGSSVDQLAITISQDNTAGEPIQTVQYEMSVRINNGTVHRLRGNLANHLSSEQMQWAKGLMAALVTKAAGVVD